MYMRVTDLSLGLGPSIKNISYVLVFSDPAAFDAFEQRGWQWQAGAEASAKLDDMGGAWEGAWQISPGVHVYQLTDSGLALEVFTIKAMKFYPDKGLN